MQLTYRGISYRKSATVATPETGALTYRGITFERPETSIARPHPVGLIYRGQEYNNTDVFLPSVVASAF
jgi:hypothetical protein